MSKIPEDSYEPTAYKSTRNNSKVHLVHSDSPTSDTSTNRTTPNKLRYSKISQHIWSRRFNYKQEPKYLKRYYGNKNHWYKAKDNWAATISEAQCDFILKSDYIPPYKSNPYVCNTSNLTDGYIFKILDLNIPTSDSKQCRNSLERFGKRYPNGEGFITNVCGAWFYITAL